MKLRKFILGAAALAAVALPAGNAIAGTKTYPAVPSGSRTWTDCTANFVRSSSGIINETNRTCAGAQNPWTSLNVYLQFRPQGGTANAACDPTGLVVPTFPFSTSDPALTDYFVVGQTYNTCVYAVNNQLVSSGQIDSASAAGATTAPAPLAGTYNVCVSGTWKNGPWWLVDAEYVQQFGTTADGTPGTGNDSSADGSVLGWHQSWPGYEPNDFGDVTVNGSFVDWGTYTSTHSYCTPVTLAKGAPVTLTVWDSGYTDNLGLLDYTFTYAHA